MNESQLARTLGIFGLGLGLVEILAPRRIARLIGIGEEHETTLQLLGLREIASGLGIVQGEPTYFLWSRVAGDIMDLGLLGSFLNADRGNRSRRVQYAMVAAAAVTAADILATVLHTRSTKGPASRDERPMERRGAISREDLKRASADEPMSQRSQGQSSSERTLPPVPNVDAGI